MKGWGPCSTVISTICLFLVLGGGAYAAIKLPKNSVGTKQLKNGAVSLAKINSAAKSALKGAIGATGAPGAPGAPGATHVVVREGETEIDSSVFCEPNEVATGGGGSTPEVEELLWGSTPIMENGKPIGWFAGAETASGEARPVTAFVVCASP